MSNVYASGKSGFEVGFIFNMRLGEYFDVRALPKVSFYERSINYTFKGDEEPVIADFQSSVLEIPFLIKYSLLIKNDKCRHSGQDEPAHGAAYCV